MSKKNKNKNKKYVLTTNRITTNRKYIKNKNKKYATYPHLKILHRFVTGLRKVVQTYQQLI